MWFCGFADRQLTDTRYPTSSIATCPATCSFFAGRSSGRAGASAGQRGAAWFGLVGWVGGQGRADWWESARARRVLATPALASAWCNVFWTCLPPRQPGARTRGRMAGPGRREAGRSGRRWAGWAGWWAGWVDGGGGDEGRCKHFAMVIASSHHPSSPQRLVPNPDMPPPCPLRLLHRPPSFCVVSLTSL